MLFAGDDEVSRVVVVVHATCGRRSGERSANTETGRTSSSRNDATVGSGAPETGIAASCRQRSQNIMEDLVRWTTHLTTSMPALGRR